MALIEYPEADSLSDAARGEIERFETTHRRPSLLRRMLAWFPPALGVADALYHPCFQEGRLPRELKEILFVVSSHERGCFYCAGGHSRFLVTEFGFDQTDVERLRSGEPLPGTSAADAALIAFVRKLSHEPQKTVAADIEVLRSHGWTEPEIVEAMVMNMASAFTNVFALAMHLEDDISDEDGYF